MVDRSDLRPPTGTADRTARRLEIHLRRRIDAVTHGEFATLTRGPGSDNDDARTYQPGDDVRRIDWAATARTGTTHVRDTTADRELSSLIVFPGAASLTFGTGTVTKWEIALAVIAELGATLARNTNSVGAVLTGPHGVEIIPVTTRRAQHRAIIRRAIHLGPRANKTSLTDALTTARRIMKRRSLIVIVSDFQGHDGWDVALGRLGRRHDVLVIEIADRYDASVARGDQPADTETTNNATRRRDRVRTVCHQAGATHLRIDTDAAWAVHLATHLRQRRHHR